MMSKEGQEELRVDAAQHAEAAKDDSPEGRPAKTGRADIYAASRERVARNRAEAEDAEPDAKYLGRRLELEAAGLSDEEIVAAMQDEFSGAENPLVDKTRDPDAEDAGDDDDDETKQVDTTDELVKIRVNGADRWATPEEVAAAGSIAALQKELSAEERLEEAAAERRRLVAERQQLERERAELVEARTTQLPTGAAGATGDDPDAGDLKEISKDLASKFFTTDEDELAESLHQALRKVAESSKRAAPTPKPAAANPTAQTTGLTAEQIEANRYFAAHFEDLARDPKAMEAVRNRIEIERTERPDASLVDVVKAAGEKVSIRLHGRRPSERPADITLREERKREAIGARPVATSLRPNESSAQTRGRGPSIDETRRNALSKLIEKRNQRHSRQ